MSVAITGLPAKTGAVVGADLLELVEDTGGTPKSVGVTVTELLTLAALADGSRDFSDNIKFATSAKGITAGTGADGTFIFNLADFPDSSTGICAVRLFRETTSTGDKSLVLFNGDGTNNPEIQLGVDGMITYFDTGANVAIGKKTASYELDVTGDINATGAVRVNGTALTAGGTTVTTLTDAASVAVDCDSSSQTLFKLAITVARAMANPSNVTEGGSYSFRVTGNFDLTWGTAYHGNGVADIPDKASGTQIYNFIGAASNILEFQGVSYNVG